MKRGLPDSRLLDDQIPRKAPNVEGWERWMKSAEAASCVSGMATGKYLENRLWLAYLRGWRDSEQYHGKNENPGPPQAGLFEDRR